MKNNKKFNLKEQYLKSWIYLKESKKFIYGVIIMFFVFSLIGFSIPAPEEVSLQIIEFIKELIKQTEGMNQFELIRFIFLNNLQSSFFGMILGVILGIFPIIALVSNGYLLGFVSYASVKSEGFLILLRLLPHGIFELPAIFISFALGIKLGTFVFHDKKKELFDKYIKNSLRVFFLIILPLLIIAAIIEGSLIFLSK